MSDGIEFGPDLYHGTADDYDRFRVLYPQGMIDDLLGWTEPTGCGRLLDLACGTGQITFAIANDFSEVWAVDQEPEMIEVVREKARAAGVSHIRTLVSRAEELAAPADAFELAAIGNAFHRLRREAVAAAALRCLQPGRCIALLWSSSPWAGDADWQRALFGVLEHWKVEVVAQARVPDGWERVRQERPDRDVLTACGFQAIRKATFPTIHDWTADTVIGFVYSTSLLPRAIVGSRAAAFENDLRRELTNYEVDSKLRDTLDCAYELARRPS